LDIVVPGMNGFGLVEEIRRLEAAGRPAPLLLAITAGEYELTQDGARSAGFDGHMLKPLNPAAPRQMMDAVRRRRQGV
jgi:CheY-like chemotaxis protein